MVRKINPNFMLGTMCALFGIYPATCHPDDVFGAYEFRRKALMFSDVTCRGYYPNYAQSIFDEYGFTLKMELGDEKWLKENTSDYLEKTAWGWPIDPEELRFVLNELYDRFQKT